MFLIFIDYLRSGLFYFSMVLTTLVFCVGGLPALVSSSATFWIMKYWAKTLLFALALFHNLKLDIKVDQPLKETGQIIACKHQSMLEILGLLATVPRPVFFLKSDLLFVPFVNLFLLRTKQLFVWRGVHNHSMLLKSAPKIIDERNIIIFPEGTRVAPGAPTVYKKGVMVLYKNIIESGRKCDVIPASTNAGMYWGRRSIRKNPGTAKLHLLKPITLQNTDVLENIAKLQKVIEDDVAKL